MIFNTKNGIEKIKLGWKEEHKKGNKTLKGYYYIIPAKIADTRKATEFFASTQNLFVPSLTTTLNLLEFKAQDLAGVTYNKKTDTKDLFVKEAQDLNLEEINFDALESTTTASSKMYRLGAIEVLHKLFKDTRNKIYWPNDVKYVKVDDAKKVQHHPHIKEVHLYKKLMGDTLVDNPLQQLVDLSITQTNFNITAKGVQPLVIELHNGEKYEAKQYRAKILVQEGIVRIPYLYGEITQELHTELIEAGAISESKYIQGKVYKIEFAGVSGKELPLVNPKIKKIPMDEIIDLVWDIETLLVRQTVYNRGLKTLQEKTRTFVEYTSSPEDTLMKELGISSSGVYNPIKTDEVEETNVMRNTSIGTKINIDIEKFPKTAITKEETETLEGLMKLDRPMDALLKQKAWMEQEIENIKKSLAEKRYKLALIKTAFFVRGFTEDLPYYTDEDGKYSFEKEVKAADSYDNKKEMRYLVHSKKQDLKLKVEIMKVIT